MRCVAWVAATVLVVYLVFARCSKRKQSCCNTVQVNIPFHALNGERYHSAPVSSDPGSWNIRDNRMAQTVKRLLEHDGIDVKIIV